MDPPAGGAGLVLSVYHTNRVVLVDIIQVSVVVWSPWVSTFYQVTDFHLTFLTSVRCSKNTQGTQMVRRANKPKMGNRLDL